MLTVCAILFAGCAPSTAPQPGDRSDRGADAAPLADAPQPPNHPNRNHPNRNHPNRNHPNRNHPNRNRRSRNRPSRNRPGHNGPVTKRILQTTRTVRLRRLTTLRSPERQRRSSSARSGPSRSTVRRTRGPGTTSSGPNGSASGGSPRSVWCCSPTSTPNSPGRSRP
jgi:hypothetical protein